MNLILLEGLPGTGKSTNSGFLRTQITVLGEQINKRWTSTGTIFRRMTGS